MDFEEFAAAELPGLVRFAGVLTGDRQLAHDVLTDALITASGRWGRIGSMEHPLAYVRRMVTTTYLADRRRNTRRRTDLTDVDRVLDRGSPDGTPAVDDRAEMAGLLRELSGQQRAAVVMRFYLDYPDAQIADELGCSAATVRSHISHAMAALRAVVTTRPTTEEGRPPWNQPA